MLDMEGVRFETDGNGNFYTTQGIPIYPPNSITTMFSIGIAMELKLW
jgi:hypothetical protein